MNNITGLPVRVDESGPEHYVTPCPVYIHPVMLVMDSNGKYPLIRQLEQETGLTGSIDEQCNFTLVNGVSA